MRCKCRIDSIFLIIGCSTIIETVIQIGIGHACLWGESKRYPSGITWRYQTYINNIWWKTPGDHTTSIISGLDMFLILGIIGQKMYLTAIYISHARNCITTLAVIKTILIKNSSSLRHVQWKNFKSDIKMQNEPFVLTPGVKIP